MKRILIIGTGSIGERHLRCFQNTGEAEVSACEPNEALGKTVAERYGCRWYASVEEALGHGLFDAAVICTPAHTHIPIARQCIERGLQLLIEKPLSVSLDGIDALQDLICERNAIVRVAYVYRSFPIVARAKEILETGAIGEIKQVVSASGQHFPTFRPAYREIYYARHSAGGGAIQDALTHGVHGVEWLVGPVKRVFAYAEHQVLEGVDVEDTVNVVARLGNGALASFSLNQFQAPNEGFIAVHGTLGSVKVETRTQRVGLFLHGDDDWKWEELPTEGRDGVFIAQAREFIAALNGQPDQLATLQEGLQTLRVNLAVLESSRTRGEVTV